MLQNKDITKIDEIKTLFNDSWTQPEFFSHYLKLFRFPKSSNLLNSIKKSGFNLLDIIHVLFILPFMSHKNIHSYAISKDNNKKTGEKDVYYRTLQNQNIKWRSFLLLFVKQYLKLSSKLTSSDDDIKCLIFDDTDIEKRGKKIEGISKIFNHVTHRYIFGYKLLVAGYWNGSVFIPVDFSFHRENKDNKTKKYGLSKKEQKKQKSVKRDKNLPVYKRFKELNSKKTDMIIQMFRRVNKRMIPVDYILMDSWFTSMSVIKKLISVNCNVNIIGMYKYNSTVVLNGKTTTIKHLKKNKDKIKRSRKMNLHYKTYKGEIDGVSLNIFITKRGSKDSWHTIISTDLSLSLVKVVEIYSIRWSIEVFFKEAKQLLGLGKCQSTNFDVQVAQTTITMLQYLLMSLKYRLEAYETIGGLFKETKQEYIEYKLNERLFAVIIDIIADLDILPENINIEQVIEYLLLKIKYVNPSTPKGINIKPNIVAA